MAMKAREYLQGGDIVVVNCTHQCNVLVMDDTNYNAYRNGSRASYYGGAYKYLPARISVPHAGYWNVVLEAPGGARFGMSYLKAA